MFIINNKKFFIGFSIAIILLSVITVLVYGLKPGIDFRGGALTEVNYTEGRPTMDEVRGELTKLSLGEVIIQPTGETGYIIKSRDLTEAERANTMKALSIGDTKKVEEKSFNSIGPSVGRELTRKAILSILVVSLAIILYIAYAFRHVSKPVSSWKYGLIAIITLVHDITIPTAVFALLGHFRGVEIDSLFVVALLTILGLSVSDTIVVFDRIRENLRVGGYKTFAETVGNSLKQTFTRSINTSLTVIIALLALYFFGPESTKNFALVLVVGMFFGTYSSIFVASPVLVLVEEAQQRKKLKKSGKR